MDQGEKSFLQLENIVHDCDLPSVSDATEFTELMPWRNAVRRNSG